MNRIRLVHWLSVVFLVSAVWAHDTIGIVLGIAIYLATEIKITAH